LEPTKWGGEPNHSQFVQTEKEENMDEYNRKIFTVTWWKDRPHEVYTCKDGRYNSYDIDWDRAGQGYYHWSGCWSSSDHHLPDSAHGLPTGVKTLNDFIKHYDLIYGETVYCKICEDCMPEDSPCEHLIWDDEAGYWGGLGSTENNWYNNLFKQKRRKTMIRKIDWAILGAWVVIVAGSCLCWGTLFWLLYHAVNALT